MAVPTNGLLDRVSALLAADATSLGAAAALKVHLSVTNIVPSPTLTPASFTEIAFTGYAALSAGAAPQQFFKDPVTGYRVVQLNEPAGGWHWQATAATGLPLTAYTYYVTDSTSATLWGSATLPQPVTLAGIQDSVDIAQVRFSIPSGVIV